MNLALIIAGGSGTRMGFEIPKQFLNVDDKPIIIYTLEAFQRHPLIDKIAVVCISGWHDVLKAYANQYGISKLEWVVDGGETGQESIRNGIQKLYSECDKDDIVVIHDGIRPLVDSDVLNDVIVKCKKYGNAVTSLPYNEQIFVVDADDASTTTAYVNRDTIRRVSTPQAYNLELINSSYDYAFEHNIGIHGSSYANTLMVDLGHRLYFASGSDKNIKLTNKDDLDMFKSLLEKDK